MTTLTITVNGNKPGEQIFFILKIKKSNFLRVVDMDFETVEDVREGMEHEKAVSTAFRDFKYKFESDRDQEILLSWLNGSIAA